MKKTMLIAALKELGISVENGRVKKSDIWKATGLTLHPQVNEIKEKLMEEVQLALENIKLNIFGVKWGLRKDEITPDRWMLIPELVDVDYNLYPSTTDFNDVCPVAFAIVVSDNQKALEEVIKIEKP
jgi:hypothetical protein